MPLAAWYGARVFMHMRLKSFLQGMWAGGLAVMTYVLLPSWDTVSEYLPWASLRVSAPVFVASESCEVPLLQRAIFGANQINPKRIDESILAAIRDAAAMHALDEQLVLAVIYAESGFNPRAVSRRGAQGLMQLMPATAAWLGVRDPFSIRDNVSGGVRYLSQLLGKYNGDVELALAAYNAGPGSVARFNNSVPPFRETQNYVRKVVCQYRQLRSV